MSYRIEAYRDDMNNEVITIPLLGFNAENFAAQLMTPVDWIDIHFGQRRRRSSPHPTRRQRRLCARTGHPQSALSPVFRGTVGAFTMREDGADMDGHVTGGFNICNRCGAELPIGDSQTSRE